jgi:hypothetical protein
VAQLYPGHIITTYINTREQALSMGNNSKNAQTKIVCMHRHETKIHPKDVKRSSFLNCCFLNCCSVIGRSTVSCTSAGHLPLNQTAHTVMTDCQQFITH